MAHEAAGEDTPKAAPVRPRVSFDSQNIWRRLQSCETVARAYGWHASEISRFSQAVRDAFSYEDAMAIIERNFEIVGGG